MSVIPIISLLISLAAFTVSILGLIYNHMASDASFRRERLDRLSIEVLRFNSIFSIDQIFNLTEISPDGDIVARLVDEKGECALKLNNFASMYFPTLIDRTQALVKIGSDLVLPAIRKESVEFRRTSIMASSEFLHTECGKYLDYIAKNQRDLTWKGPIVIRDNLYKILGW